MKKNLLTSIVLVVCGVHLCNAQTAAELWKSTYMATAQKYAAISHTLLVDGEWYGEPFNHDTICSATCTATEFWQTKGDDGKKYLHITQDSFCLINRQADDIVYGSVWKDDSSQERNSVYNMLINPHLVGWGMVSTYAPLYYTRWERDNDKWLPETVSDSTLDGMPHWAFVKTSHITGLLDNDGSIVFNDDTIYYFVDKKTKLLDRMDIYSHNKMYEEYGYRYERYLFRDIKVYETMPHAGEEWNIGNPIYDNTPKYDINEHVPASLANARPEHTYKISDPYILNYPLTDITGDTTTIGEKNGWLLIEIFQYGCRPCAEFHQKMQKESMADGLCELEKNGVKVVCIHPHTGLSETFKRYVNKYGLQDKAYCARELSPLIEGLSGYPTYYLLSPDRKIVLCNENDTEKILKAKAEYETQH